MALGRQVLFVYSLFFLYSLTGRTSVVLFAMAAYAGHAFIRRHSVRWIAPAWVATLVGIVGLSLAPVDLKLSSASPPGLSLEQNGWAYMGTMNSVTGEFVRSEGPVSWGHHGCFVDFNAAKWLIVVGLGHDSDWVWQAIFEVQMLKLDYQLAMIVYEDRPLPTMRFAFGLLTGENP